MYYLWEHILSFEVGTLRVNLLFNRASAWCDIHSYIPYEGRVDLKIKKSCERTLVRMPEWIAGGSQQVSCEVNGRPRSIQWQGRYVEVGYAKPGDTITVKFPISERTVQETIGASATSWRSAEIRCCRSIRPVRTARSTSAPTIASR